ncbi:MAG: hypothetical protein K6C11_01440, partial [Bacilli bacterium]|nr:hypothetical protein [Bacilli bacterium]
AQFKTTAVLSQNENGVDVFTTTVEDEPKYTLTINKKNGNDPVSGVWFYIQDKTGVSITDAEGKAILSELSADEEYTLVERKADGYYLLGDINFKLAKEGNGNYTLQTESGELRNINISNTAEAGQVQVSVDVNNEKVPTYQLKVVKIEDSTDENKKYLSGAKFELSSADSTTRTYYTTNENGEIIIDDLYAHVDGKDISGLYKLQEVKAPTGYSNNAEIIEFKVVKNQDNYSIEIVNESTLNTVYQKSVEGNVATITISDKPMFKLVKTDKDTGERLANVNFVIYELDASGNVKDYAKDVNNEYIGKLIDEQYVVTTDENGEISLPLKDGKYQMFELDYYGYKKNGTLYNFTVGVEDVIAVDPYASYFTLADNIPEPTGGIIEINYIEDLLDMALGTNRSYNTNAGEENPYINKYIKLMRTLDFNQDSSYRNPNDQTTYGDYNKNNEVQTIKEELTTGRGWLPIGSYSSEVFVGNTFDGQGFEIRNLYYDGNYAGQYSSYGALINCPKNCVIKNLGITGSFTKAYAAFVAFPYGSLYVINCYNKANISGGSYVAGIIGDTWSASPVYVDNCYNTGKITGYQVGGITGYQGSGPIELRNCHNDGEITGAYAGGIHSMDRTNVMVNCYNTGKITGTSDAGGIAARKEGSDKILVNCYNTGDVTGRNAYGITNSSSSSIYERCYNTGKITGTAQAGGITYNAKRITECFNTGDILSDQWAGGLTLSNIQIIQDCYNDGKVEAVSGQAYGICYGATTSMNNVINAGKVVGRTARNLSTDYYVDNVHNSYYIDATKVSDEGIEISEEYSKSVEFYNQLNMSGAWSYNPYKHPQLKNNQVKANITEGTQINIENQKKQYKITTDVNDINRPKGGSISGEDELVYEEVKHDESNSKAIIMTPEEGYEIVSITINDKKINYEVDENGIFTINPGDITNIQEDKHIVVTYGLTSQIYTIQKVDEDDESVKLQGAEFSIEQTEDYSPQIQVGELENTSTSIKNTIFHEDAILEDVSCEIVSQDESKGFVESDGKYVINLGETGNTWTPYVASGTLKIDLTEKEGVYSVRVNITSDGANALTISRGSDYYYNYEEVAKINKNEIVTNKNYYHRLQGGTNYEFSVYGSSDTNTNGITINSIDVAEGEDEFYGFELVDGKYRSDNNEGVGKAIGEFKVDLRQRPGEYKFLFNNMYSTNNSTIQISATDYSKYISIESNQNVNKEITVDGGKLYTIKYTHDSQYRPTAGVEYYLTFEPPVVERLLTTITAVTDENGVVSINAAPGKYKITETKAPEGYELNSQEFEVEVTENSEKSIKITNKKLDPSVNI